MTTADEARNRTINAIKEKHQEQIEMLDVMIAGACDNLEHTIDVTFEDGSDIKPLCVYLDKLGYNAYQKSDKVLHISWKSIVRSNMDIKSLYEKSRLNLIPPPPASLSKLTEEERKEITDYIFAKAKQVYDLTIKEAEKEVEKKNNTRLSSKIASEIFQYVLMFIIVVVFVYLIHRYVPHHFLRNPY